MKVKVTEGDINQSEIRAKWQKENLSEETVRKLCEDESIFIKQALSTPCLNSVTSTNGVYLIDSDGRKVIDFHGNSVHQLGYNNKRLVDALKKQLDTLAFSPRRYANDAATECAKRLVSLMPSNDYKVLFTTSGAVSNETALKLSRIATGKHKTLAAKDSFHGATFLTISVGGTDHFRNGIEPLPDYCHHYEHFSEDDKHNQKVLKFIEQKCKNDKIGAIILEPIRCTDIIIPKKEYLQKIREICDRYDVTLIFDEIPTAFGRTGKMFAFENFDVEPDILTLGKGLAGGLIPFSAVIAKKKFDICDTMSMGHFTFEKNPLAAAVTIALLDEIHDKNLLERANEVGEKLKQGILEIESDLVYEIRQIGAMVGVELRENGIKANFEAEQILYKSLTKGLSFKISGGNVLTLTPPIVITDKELKCAISILKSSINEMAYDDNERAR